VPSGQIPSAAAIGGGQARSRVSPDDRGTRDALQFLTTHEITHMKASCSASKASACLRCRSAKLEPIPGLVDQYFDDSTGAGENSAVDVTGPWNDESAFRRVDNPAFKPHQMQIGAG
jgi:Mn-containing catalase